MVAPMGHAPTGKANSSREWLFRVDARARGNADLDEVRDARFIATGSDKLKGDLSGYKNYTQAPQ